MPAGSDTRSGVMLGVTYRRSLPVAEVSGCKPGGRCSAAATGAVVGVLPIGLSPCAVCGVCRDNKTHVSANAPMPQGMQAEKHVLFAAQAPQKALCRATVLQASRSSAARQLCPWKWGVFCCAESRPPVVVACETVSSEWGVLDKPYTVY